MSIFFLEITRQNILAILPTAPFLLPCLPCHPLPPVGIPPYGLFPLEKGEFNAKYENWSKKNPGSFLKFRP
jgi:hypothetical protein